jgi:hypothetical protein
VERHATTQKLNSKRRNTMNHMEIECYDGRLMNLGWSRPWLLDLDGLEIPDTVPLLKSHDEKIKIISHIKAKKTEFGTLVFEYEEKCLENEIDYAKTDFGIGADVELHELVRNTTININKKPFIINDNGIYLIKKARLREISIVNKIKINDDSQILVAQNKDNVNHPSHYTSHPSGIECIEITKHYDFCIGNAIKYLWRSGLKHEEGMDDKAKQVEDLKKAIWYINQKIEMLEGK